MVQPQKGKLGLKWGKSTQARSLHFQTLPAVSSQTECLQRKKKKAHQAPPPPFPQQQISREGWHSQKKAGKMKEIYIASGPGVPGHVQS